MIEEIFYIKAIKGEYAGYIFQVCDKSGNGTFLKISNSIISNATINVENVILATEKEFKEFNEKYQNQDYQSEIFL